MSLVFLAPASNPKSKKHLDATVRSEVSIERVQAHLSPAETQLLNDASSKGLRLWGSKSGEKKLGARRWAEMNVGDVVLFGLGRGRLGTASVTGKFQSAALARELWGTTATKNGMVQAWEHMFALDELQERAYDKADLNRAMGRKPNSNIQEFVPLSEEASASVLKFLKLSAQPRSSRIPRNVPSFDALAAMDSLDRAASGRSRLEQKLLRDYLLFSDEGECGVCHRTFPITFLVAGHIKPRSACTDAEKLDFQNVAMPICRLGCDELFERKLIIVDASGAHQATTALPDSGPVREYADAHVLGGHSSKWRSNPGSRGYFAFHRQKA